MRIIYIHQYFKTRSMSGGTRSFEMARRLVSYGHEIDMVTSDTNPVEGQKGWRVTCEDGIRVHWLSVKYNNSMGSLRRVLAFLSFAWGAARRSRQIKADLVFATSTPLFVALPAVHASKRLDIPLVFDVRDLWPEVPISLGILKNPQIIRASRALERYAYKNSDHIVALSPGMKDGVTATGYPASRVSVIPNASDRDLFRHSPGGASKFRKANSWLQDRPLAIYAGTLGYANRVEYLARLASFAQELDPDLCFLVVGSGRHEPFIREVATKLDVLGKNFFMLPPLPKQEIPAILGAADVALSLFRNDPSLLANSANKVFDALASGTPVAINYGGWQADFLIESGAGIVLPPEDEEEAAMLFRFRDDNGDTL